LRTSELSYLEESYTFYDAIEKRKYFENLIGEKISVIYIKKLRYYLRFILVCLLQNKKTKLSNIIENFKESVKKFEELGSSTFSNEFTSPRTEGVLNSNSSGNLREWKMVIQELDNFLKFENLVSIGKTIDYRFKNLDFIESMTISCGIIVGNNDKQVKYSELSLNMYRILQSLEKTQKNPKKILLYRPTFNLLFNTISNSFFELKKDQALFLYLSSNSNKNEIVLRDNQGLTVEDLIPFTRNPFFMIVEAEFIDSIIPNGNKFKKPFVGLFSNDVETIEGIGMMTWFLTEPIQSFCYLNQMNEISSEIYDKMNEILNQFYLEIMILLVSQEDSLDNSIKIFLGNCFTRMFILRFILYSSFLICLKKQNLPRIFPNINKKIFENEIFTTVFEKLKKFKK
jgi:hypothetical protein